MEPSGCWPISSATEQSPGTREFSGNGLLVSRPEKRRQSAARMIPGALGPSPGPGSIGARPGAVLALLFGILFTGVADNQVILPVLPAIAESFGHPVTRVTWAVTLYAFAAAVL